MVSSRIEIHSLLPLLNDRQVLQNEKATHAVKYKYWGSCWQMQEQGCPHWLNFRIEQIYRNATNATGNLTFLWIIWTTDIIKTRKIELK